MHFSTRTRYGLRFLIKLASQPKGTRLQLSHVAKEENISPGYLEQIVRALKPLGILRAARGAGGGYSLAKSPEDINLEEILLHLEGEISPVTCIESEHVCMMQDTCKSRIFWKKLDNHIRIFLRDVSLLDIVQSEKNCIASI